MRSRHRDESNMLFSPCPNPQFWQTPRTLQEKFMTKKMIVALILLGLSVVVMVMNRGRVDVDLIITSVNGIKSLVFLGFTAMGVLIGVLLK
jgi:uncharacterized integral membrane protein